MRTGSAQTTASSGGSRHTVAARGSQRRSRCRNETAIPPAMWGVGACEPAQMRCFALQSTSSNHEQYSQHPDNYRYGTEPTSAVPEQLTPGTQQQQQQQQRRQQHTSRWKAMQSILQQNGPGAFLSYITVSNTLSVAMLSSAWVLYTRTTGLTPLQVGQWPKFLVFYAGAYAVAHIARPLKLAVGLAGTPVGTALVEGVARLLHSSKNAALVVLLVAEAALLLCGLGAVVVYANTLAAAAI